MRASSLLRKKPKVDKLAVAQGVATRFWGVSEPEANDFTAVAGELRALNLSAAQVQDLRDWLPTQATGTVGDRIKSLDGLFARMEGGA